MGKNVDVDRSLPLLVAVTKSSFSGNPGVGEVHVDWAEVLLSQGQHTTDVVDGRHVSAGGRSPFGTDALCDDLGAIAIDVGDNDPSADIGKPVRQCRANTTRAAGHDGNFASDFHRTGSAVTCWVSGVTVDIDSPLLTAWLARLRPQLYKNDLNCGRPLTPPRTARPRPFHHFQSDDGARAFATICSYLATARKQRVGALDGLAQLFRGEAWMPPSTT
jgi:hypothetical protein